MPITSVARPLFEGLEVPMIYPDDSPRARATDPITSHEAADSNNVAASRAAVLRTLRVEGPLIDQQLVLAMQSAAVWGKFPNYTESRIRTARHELVESGIVRDAGYFRLTASGRRSIVWEVVE